CSWTRPLNQARMSLSRRIVIRSLLRDRGLSAPRLARVESYTTSGISSMLMSSVLRIIASLAPCGTACRNQVDVILARHGIHHGQKAAIGVHPRPREALLRPGREVFLGYEVVSIKHGGRIG